MSHLPGNGHSFRRVDAAVSVGWYEQPPQVALPLAWVAAPLCSPNAIPVLARRKILQLRHQHSDHAVLARVDEKLAIPGSADMQVGTWQFCAHRFVDQFLQ
jgi:hypothetical protein